MADTRIIEALKTATDTRDVVLGAGATDAVGEAFRRNFGDATTVIVADGITWDVTGPQVEESLRDAGCPMVDRYVYPGRPTLYAKHDNCVPLVASLRGHDAIPVAVGSGTLNDLVKRSVYEVERPYMVSTRRPARRRRHGDGCAVRGTGDVGPGHAGGAVVAAGLRRRAPVQPPVGDGGARPRRRPTAVARVQGRARR